jgi:hypothetical protein
MSIARKLLLRKLDAMNARVNPTVIEVVGGLPGYSDPVSIRRQTRHGYFAICGGLPPLTQGAPVEGEREGVGAQPVRTDRESVDSG